MYAGGEAERRTELEERPSGAHRPQAIGTKFLYMIDPKLNYNNRPGNWIINLNLNFEMIFDACMVASVDSPSR
jgi:hypothetical protein